MKGAWLLLFFLILISGSALSIDIDLPGSSILNRTRAIDAPNIDVVGLKYEPFPVEPGERFDLWLRIKNLGTVDAKDVKIEIIETNTFSYSGKKIVDIGSLSSNRETVIKFEDLKVNENAVEGTNNIEFMLFQGAPYETTRTKKIEIEIRSVTPTLFIKVDSTPEKIPQGQKGNITLTVTNTDESVLEDISLKLNFPKEIIPIGSTTEGKINRLNPSESKSLNFEVTPLADAEAKAYKVNLNVTYHDEIGNFFHKDDALGVLVGSSANFVLNIEDTDFISKGKNGEITLSISNTGPDEIKFLLIEIIDSKNYEVLSAKKTYLGNLESDDFETAQFDIFLKKSGEIPLDVKVSYSDSFNNEFTETITLQLKSFSGFELRRYGITEDGGLLNVIIYLFLIILVYLTYKNWKKERDIVKSLKEALKTIFFWIIKSIKKIKWRYIRRLPRRIRNFLRGI